MYFLAEHLEFSFLKLLYLEVKLILNILNNSLYNLFIFWPSHFPSGSASLTINQEGQGSNPSLSTIDF